MRLTALMLAFGAMAAPAFAQDFTEDQKAAFIDAIAANDCSMSEDEAEELMPAAGINREVSGAIAVYLIDRDQATLSDDMQLLTLSEELCQ
jgi:hypothetical protein